MADYYADLALQQQWEFDEEVANVLKKNEESLFLETKESENELIIGIRNYYAKYKKLSQKQKFCLAKWIVENSETYNQ